MKFVTLKKDIFLFIYNDGFAVSSLINNHPLERPKPIQLEIICYRISDALVLKKKIFDFLGCE